MPEPVFVSMTYEQFYQLLTNKELRERILQAWLSIALKELNDIEG
jgi:hypothetical protein